jgi:hypothetical protein
VLACFVYAGAVRFFGLWETWLFWGSLAAFFGLAYQKLIYWYLLLPHQYLGFICA